MPLIWTVSEQPPRNKKMHLVEPAAVFESGRLKHPYDRVMVDSVIRPFKKKNRFMGLLRQKSTTELTRPIRVAQFTRFARPSLKMRLASLGADTSAWTSFYAHPVDHQFAVLGAALATPVAMTYVGFQLTVPIVTLFMLGAIITFTASHHTVIGPIENRSYGSDHLTHHQKFTVNYGNFAYFDKLAGTYVGEKFKTFKNAERKWQ